MVKPLAIWDGLLSDQNTQQLIIINSALYKSAMLRLYIFSIIHNIIYVFIYVSFPVFGKTDVLISSCEKNFEIFISTVLVNEKLMTSKR